MPEGNRRWKGTGGAQTSSRRDAAVAAVGNGGPKGKEDWPKAKEAGQREANAESRKPEPELFQGTIKSFDDVKGFGFIRCQDTYERYNSDVFLHHNHLNGFGVGAVVKFAVRQNQKGQPQALDLVDGDAGISNAANGRSDAPEQDNHTDGWEYTGRIKFFDDIRGSGFIRCQEAYEAYGKDVVIRQASLNGFTVGDHVRFSVWVNDGEPEAADLFPNVPWDPDVGKEDDFEDLLYEGTIKCFDVSKRYGFIRCQQVFQEYCADVFVHQNQLNGFGVGDDVRFALRLNRHGKPQATAVCPCDYSPAPDYDVVDGVADAGAFGIPTGAADAGAFLADGPRLVHEGLLKWVHAEKGYGFITCQEILDQYGKDIFVPQKQINGFGAGDHVRFSVRVNAKGQPQAADLSSGQGVGQEQPNGAPLTAWESEVTDLGAEDDAPQALAFPEHLAVLNGTIKSFDSEKGYGFISCPETYGQYERDVFLHARQVNSFNPGDRVVFSARINNNGHLQAYRLRESSCAAAWLAGFDNPDEPAPATEKDEFTGELKSFSALHGYGFIYCPALHHRFGRDVFIHQSQFEGLTVGDKVTFRLQVRKGQPQAKSVVRAGLPLSGNGTSASAATGTEPQKEEHMEQEGRVPSDPLEDSGLNRRLLRACASARVESVGTVRQCLVDGADPGASDVTGQTALMISALNVRHNEKKCRLLIEYKADVDAMYNEYLSVLQWTRERINNKFAAFLQGLARGEPVEYDVAFEKPPGDEF